MEFRKKNRLASIAKINKAIQSSAYGFMRGTATEIGDIVSPTWDGCPLDAELGIAYHGENGPVYYTGNGTETTDDCI